MWLHPRRSTTGMVLWSAIIAGVILALGVVRQQRFSWWMVLGAGMYSVLMLVVFATARYLERRAADIERQQVANDDSGDDNSEL